jgi:alkylated DNA repair dioxygenase AlkB
METRRAANITSMITARHIHMGGAWGQRTYKPGPSHPLVDEIRVAAEESLHYTFDTCFLNRYLNQRDSLGWHADNEPEMDNERPILTVSLGAEREIWFRPLNNLSDVTKVLLRNSSLCVMAPGMQQTHQHRIPKASFICGERISLTFRGYVRGR